MGGPAHRASSLAADPQFSLLAPRNSVARRRNNPRLGAAAKKARY
jgi:hypothetical protein